MQPAKGDGSRLRSPTGVADLDDEYHGGSVNIFSTKPRQTRRGTKRTTRSSARTEEEEEEEDEEESLRAGVDALRASKAIKVSAIIMHFIENVGLCVYPYTEGICVHIC